MSDHDRPLEFRSLLRASSLSPSSHGPRSTSCYPGPPRTTHHTPTPHTTTWYRASRCVPVNCRQAQDACHHGQYGPEGPSRGEFIVHIPVMRNNRCRGSRRAENCGFSEVAAQQQGRLHPCHDAEAVSHGPDCLVDHRDSPVALGQGARCSCFAGRAYFPGR